MSEFVDRYIERTDGPDGLPEFEAPVTYAVLGRRRATNELTIWLAKAKSAREAADKIGPVSSFEILAVTQTGWTHIRPDGTYIRLQRKVDTPTWEPVYIDPVAVDNLFS